MFDATTEKRQGIPAHKRWGFLDPNVKNPNLGDIRKRWFVGAAGILLVAASFASWRESQEPRYSSPLNSHTKTSAGYLVSDYDSCMKRASGLVITDVAAGSVAIQLCQAENNLSLAGQEQPLKNTPSAAENSTSLPG
ncbi:MAG: hypothetical protein WCJ24_03090 [Candidatus Saccharibacteria bacterium]